jgi:hypothetical protein
MNQVSPRGSKLLNKEPLVSVSDVQRIRRQRRLAQTEEEYSTVRSHMRDLASDLKSKPTTNTKLLKITGITVIVLGIIIGVALAYAASVV